MVTLIAGFKGKHNSSKIVLDKIQSENKLYLENDKIKSCEQIEKALLQNYFDKIVFLGQKPLIRNCVCIELLAKNSDKILNTNYEIEHLAKLFEDNEIKYKFSKKPGTSYCNNIYYYTLNQLKKNNLKTQCIFLHIPFIDKFEDIDIFLSAIDDL